MFNRYTDEAEFASNAVKIAAELSLEIQHEMVPPAVEKVDRSPVTVADFTSQAIIARMLLEAYPGIALVAEEDSAVLKTPEHVETLDAVVGYVMRVYPEATHESVCQWIDWGAGDAGDTFWTLDPIDGTKGFLRGGQYVVALALVNGGRVDLGAMGCPTLSPDLELKQDGEGSIILAVREQGTWIRGIGGGEERRLRVSECQEPREGRMLRSFESGHTDPAKIDAIVRVLGIQNEPVLMDSSAKYGLLAGGEGEWIFRLVSPKDPGYVENIWDHAAGVVVVEEAGGKVTDLRGKPLDFGRGRLLSENIGVLASNRSLHEAALKAIREVGADRRPEVS